MAAEYFHIPGLSEKIIPERILQAFGSQEKAVFFIGELQNRLNDKNGLIIFNGSFVSGLCGNQNNAHYLKPIDVDRRSDLDIGIIDGQLIRHVPKTELIRAAKGLVPSRSAFKMTYPVTMRDGTVKEYTKSRKIALYNLIQQAQQNLGRLIDLKFYQDFDAWLAFCKPYWILADKTEVYF